MGPGGVRRFGGLSLRVTGLVQLMARWSSDALLRYVAEAPLQGMSEAYRKGLSTTALGETAEDVLRQLEAVKSEASHDKRLIYYLQHEVAMLKDVEGVNATDLGCIVNIESGVVHRPVVWAKDVARKRWRTVCGWAFGLSHFKVSSVSPAGAVICSRERKNAVPRRETRSNSSSSFVPSDSPNSSYS